MNACSILKYPNDLGS